MSNWSEFAEIAATRLEEAYIKWGDEDDYKTWEIAYDLWLTYLDEEGLPKIKKLKFVGPVMTGKLITPSDINILILQHRIPCAQSSWFTTRLSECPQSPKPNMMCPTRRT